MKIISSFVLGILLLSLGCNNPPEVQPVDNQISVYPNPTIYAIHIRIVNPTNLPYTIHVFGTNGGALFMVDDNQSESDYEIDIADKPKGMYQVIVQKGDIKTIQRIIKI